MLIAYLVGALLVLGYVLVIGTYLYYWKQARSPAIPEDYRGSVLISVIVPARNEQENIRCCLDSLSKQDYPGEAFEIIVVDDYSTDRTAAIVAQTTRSNLTLLKMSELLDTPPVVAFKKKAIELGIARAKGRLIATIDADCEAPPNWLRSLAYQFEKKGAVFVAGPVGFHRERTPLEKFQSLDILGMMVITGAGIQGGFMHMCNGANLAYDRQAFYAVKGFDGIDHLASGDDMLLLQKIAARYPGRIAFVKDRAALVLTRAKPDLNSFFGQRLRWATKSAAYREKLVTAILGVVFLYCGYLAVTLLLIPFLGESMIFLFLLMLLVKCLADYWLLSKATAFFERRDLLKSFFRSQLYHILYIIIVGAAANLVKTYEWKGRKVR